jgi:pyruvate/2-oxoacid:ferredoxin oxidoreductase beta subunit
MADLNGKTWRNMPAEEWLECGHKACQGCGTTICMRHALKALGRGTHVVMPACCATVIEGEFPNSALRMPVFHTAFETAAAAASGVRAAQRIKGHDRQTRVLAWAGDGGTFDIGIQALSGAAERNEDIIYVCYDNEAYMNTGIQRSSATPAGAWTTTTPTDAPESGAKKDIVQILAFHGIPYAATASAGFPDDFYRKVCRARDMRGTRFIHLLSPCPTGWRFPPSRTVSVGKLAVQTRAFPLYEVEDGRWKVHRRPAKARPVREYLQVQGRFRHLDDAAVEAIQQSVHERWRFLLGMEEITQERG